MAFNIETITNQYGQKVILLREARREGRKIRKKTIANLTRLPEPVIEGLRILLRGGTAVTDPSELLPITRSLPHGHAKAALGMARKLELDRILHRRDCRERQLALGAVINQLLNPVSKSAMARSLSPGSATTSLGMVLGLGEVGIKETPALMDWLVKRQPWIEKSLANRHLRDGILLLYDVTSTYLEGSRCPLAEFGYNRDGKKGKKQLVIGLLCTPEGCPVAVEVFAGNTGDPATIAGRVEKVRDRFGIRNIALVGDRGMITSARIREDLEPAGVDWISALKTTDLRKLTKGQPKGMTPLIPDELIPDRVMELSHPDFPGERILVCLNPRLREERRRVREELLVATEVILERISSLVARGELRGKDTMGRRVGRDANRKKVEKHFRITITDTSMTWERRERKIADEARLDGIYAIRTSLPAESVGANDAVAAYKSLSRVERAFRTIKTELDVRPVFVHTENHVRGHVFLCMLAYYLEWHMRRLLSPLLYQDDDPQGAAQRRSSPVAKGVVSKKAERKMATHRTEEGFPVHSFRTLLADLGTMTLNLVQPPGSSETVPVVAKPTVIQERAFELLGVRMD